MRRRSSRTSARAVDALLSNRIIATVDFVVAFAAEPDADADVALLVEPAAVAVVVVEIAMTAFDALSGVGVGMCCFVLAPSIGADSVLKKQFNAEIATA